MRIKKRLIAIGLLAIMAGMTGRAWAAQSDALTVTIIPAGSYAVDIDTAGVSLTFNAQALDADNNVVLPATVTIQSTFATTDLKLDALSSGAGIPWNLATTNTQDNLQMWTLFTSTTVQTIPAKSGDNFDDTNDRVGDGDTASTHQVGDLVNFEDGAFDTDSQTPLKKSHLWVRFHTPSATTDNNDKLIKLTLTAEAPN